MSVQKTQEPGISTWWLETAGDGGAIGYEPVPYWPTMPHPMSFGSDVACVATGPTGLVYVFSRGEWPLMVFDSAGNLQWSWSNDDVGYSRPHGIDVDADGNVYLVDGVLHCVEKRSPEGELLFRIGERGQPSAWQGGEPFNKPTDVTIDRASGDLFVSDGYENHKIHRFDPTGQWIGSFGSPGSDAGEFGLPHNIAFFGEHLVVADRENYRVQFFTREGEFVDQWHVHHPLSVAVGGPEGYLYVGEMGPPNIQRGVMNLGHCVSIWNSSGKRVGRLGDPQPGTGPDQFLAPHGIDVDAEGNIYVAEAAATWIGKVWGDQLPLGEIRCIRKWARVRDGD